MTRKDYIAIAAAFRWDKPRDRSQSHPYSRETFALWESLRESIADALAADNPRFDRDRFYTATEEERN